MNWERHVCLCKWFTFLIHIQQHWAPPKINWSRCTSSKHVLIYMFDRVLERKSIFFLCAHSLGCHCRKSSVQFFREDNGLQHIHLHSGQYWWVSKHHTENRLDSLTEAIVPYRLVLVRSTTTSSAETATVHSRAHTYTQNTEPGRTFVIYLDLILSVDTNLRCRIRSLWLVKSTSSHQL